MEHDDRHLDFLSSSMIQYFNEVLIHKNCVSSTFRKYSVKNDEDVEFSLLLKSPIDSSCDDNKSYNQIESSCLTEEDVRNIKIVSESWCLHLANVSVRESKLCLKLNRPHTFYTIIKSVLSRKSNYGKCSSEKQIARVTSDHGQTEGLTELRLGLVKNAAENLLKAGGYRVTGDEESEVEVGCWIHFSLKNSRAEDEGGQKKIICGPVVNSATKMKETQISAQDYRRLRLRDMQTMTSGDKKTNQMLIESLVDTCIKVTLLQVKACQALNLNLESELTGPRESGSKGGAFLQYNASRMAAIRKKYSESANQGIYPGQPNVEEVDFSALKEPEEWALLFNYLLEYPSLIGRLSKEMTEGKSNIHQICDFLFKLCSLFSVYYRRVRVLLEPRDHLLQTIQARLLLVMSLEQVLENAFAIFNIEKIEEM